MSPFVIDAALIGEAIAGFLWPFFRIGALFAIVPVFGGSEVPARVRIGLAVAVTALVLPLLPPPPALDPLSAASVLVTLQEIVIGLAMGLVVLLVFNAVTLAGESIAITMGLGFALMNDPQNGVQIPTVSQFYMIVALLLFLSLDGHHAALALAVESFRTLPIGASLGSDATWQLLSWAAVIFRGALGIALPALAAMLTVNLLMGVMTRAAPQMNIFSVGFPLTMTAGFVAIALTLPAFGESFGRLLDEALVALAALSGR